MCTNVLSFQNKTLRAIFNNKHVLELMEKNYRTFCALNSVTPAAPEQIKEVVLKILDTTELADKRSSKLEQDDFLKSVGNRLEHAARTALPPRSPRLPCLSASLTLMCLLSLFRLLAAFNQAGFHFNTGVGIDEPEDEDAAVDEE